MKSFERLKADLKAAVRKANARLSALESFNRLGARGGKDALNWAYAQAQREIKATRGEGKKRFSGRTRGKTQRQLQAELNMVNSFLGSQSSTITGIRSTYQDRADTLNRRYGDEMGYHFTADNIAEFFQSEEYKRLSQIYSSEQIMKGLKKLRKDERRIADQVKRTGEYHVHGNYGDVAVKSFVENAVNDLGYQSTEDWFEAFK